MEWEYFKQYMFNDNKQMFDKAKAHTSSISVIKLSKYKYNELATASADKTLKIWNLNNSAKVCDLNSKRYKYLNINSNLTSLRTLILSENNLILSGYISTQSYTIIYNISSVTTFTKYNDYSMCILTGDKIINNGQQKLVMVQLKMFT